MKHPKDRQITKYFTLHEIKDIIISIIAITFIFSFPSLSFTSIVFSFSAVVIGFLLHELAHKFVARKFGCTAFYKMWPQMLIISMLLTVASLGSLKFIAAGAVMIYPFKFGRWGFREVHLTDTEEGLIAFAGIAVNLFFALFFKMFPGDFAFILSYINAFLAFFNLLPIPPLDGSKVIRWKAWFWLIVFIVSLLLIIPGFI